MTDYNEDDAELAFLGGLLGAHRSAVCPPSSLISAYAEGKLSGDEMRSVREHVSQCRDCEETVAVLSDSLPEYQEIPGIEWESIRSGFPPSLPSYPDAKASERPAALQQPAVRTAEKGSTKVKSIFDYIGNVKELFAPAGRPFRFSYAMAAVLVMALLLTTIIWLSVSHHGSDSDVTRGVGTPAPGQSGGTDVTISAEGLTEAGTVQIADSPESFPIQSLAVAPERGTVTCRLQSGEYWIRVCSEKSESQWKKIEVDQRETSREPIRLVSAANTVLFSPSKAGQSLAGSAISYRINDKSYSCRVSSDTYETAPCTRGAELKEVTIKKGSSLWRYPGAIRIKGGRQIMKVAL